jgi:putative OPT family oligopeptide transporter
VTTEAPLKTHAVCKRPAGAKEFTGRAIAAGIIIAAFIGAAYPYVVMKIGYGPNTSIVSAIFGYLTLGMFCRDFNRWENNIVQTAGTSAGAMAFLCVIMAAFDMLAADPALSFNLALTPLQTFVWLTSAGALGVFMAVPMRRHFIIDEKLPYVDGTVVAETLIVLDAKDGAAKGAAASMGLGAAVSALLTVFREDSRVFAAAWYRIPEMLPFGPYGAKLSFGINWSLLSLGAGMLIGVRVTLSMLLGTFVAWWILPDMLVSSGAVAEIARRKLLMWIMWPGTGMLVAGGLTAMALKGKTLVRTFTRLSASSIQEDDFPMRWVIAGSIASSLVLIASQKLMLGIPVWMTLLAILVTVPMMLVGLRVFGETNFQPISILSNMVQAVFGLVAPGNVAANMVSSGVTGSIASESEGLMQDFKTGDMLDSTPRYLTYMQLIAVPVGALAVSYAYPLLRATYGIGGEHGLQSPISQKWAGFAALLSKGLGGLPPGALEAMGAAMLIGAVLTLIEQTKWRKWTPSPTGIGIGMLVPASLIITMAIGGLVELLWSKYHRKSRDKFVIPLASGFAAGEAIVAVIIPILATIGVLTLQP